MRKIFITFLILISLTAVSCKDSAADPVDTAATSAAITTTPPETEPEDVIPPETMLPAIIDNLKTALSADKNEYDEFIHALDSVLLYASDPTDEKLQSALTLCADLGDKLSLAAAAQNSLSAGEENAVAKLGMSIDDYKGLFNNYTWLRNSKINVLTGLIQNLNEPDTFGDLLGDIAQFYIDYNNFFQCDLYYSVNSMINECTAETDSVNDFINNFYPELIERFSETMKWENDNNIIIEKLAEMETKMDIIMTDFQEKTADLTREEIDE